VLRAVDAEIPVRERPIQEAAVRKSPLPGCASSAKKRQVTHILATVTTPAAGSRDGERRTSTDREGRGAAGCPAMVRAKSACGRRGSPKMPKRKEVHSVCHGYGDVEHVDRGAARRPRQLESPCSRGSDQPMRRTSTPDFVCRSRGHCCGFYPAWFRGWLSFSLTLCSRLGSRPSEPRK
jgi:hypothetical protein